MLDRAVEVLDWADVGYLATDTATVTVQLTDSDGNPVGDPITVTTDDAGAFPEGTVLPVQIGRASCRERV